MHASYAIIYKTENIKSFQVDKLLHKLFCNIIYSLMKHLCRLMSSFIYVFNSQLWIKIAVFCQKYWRLDVCVSKFLYGKQGYANSERPEYLIVKQITFMLITSYDITISQTVPTECIILYTYLITPPNQTCANSFVLWSFLLLCKCGSPYSYTYSLYFDSKNTSFNSLNEVMKFWLIL